VYQCTTKAVTVEQHMGVQTKYEMNNRKSLHNCNCQVATVHADDQWSVSGQKLTTEITVNRVVKKVSPTELSTNCTALYQSLWVRLDFFSSTI